MNRELIKGYAEELRKLAEQVEGISKDLSRDVFEEQLNDASLTQMEELKKLLEVDDNEQRLLNQVGVLKRALLRIAEGPVHVTPQGSILMEEGGMDIFSFCRNVVRSVEMLSESKETK